VKIKAINIMLTILVIVLALIPTLFVILGIQSRSGEAVGLVDSKLAKCPPTPNCVCSEYADQSSHFIEPISLTTIENVELIKAVEQIITQMRGEIVHQKEIEAGRDIYVAAIFKSSIFGFVDDFELRWDHSAQTMHIRSASRVGRGDLGVNKQRALVFTDLLNKYVQAR